jgi:tRNA pseudouridine38-40 synthase
VDGSARSRREARGSAPDHGRRLTTLRLTVEYDGTNFSGFQWQPAVRTVASVLEAALSRLLAERVKLTAAGRTDAGVHASGQVVSFCTASAFPFDRLAAALNSLLPEDLSVRETTVVERGFSARFSARERTYLYAIRNRHARSALLARYAHLVVYPLDLAAMRAAAGYLVGTHDFRSFCGTLPDGGSTLRTVARLEIEPCGELVRIAVTADGFLHHMVRAIVGTLLECGRGRRAPGELRAILAARDRSAGGVNAPACGLYLAGVRFEDGYDSFAQPAIFGQLPVGSA